PDRRPPRTSRRDRSPSSWSASRAATSPAGAAAARSTRTATCARTGGEGPGGADRKLLADGVPESDSSLTAGVRMNAGKDNGETQARPSPPAGPSDHSLLARFRRGSQDAATQLYLRYAQRLRGLARAQLSPALARRVD